MCDQGETSKKPRLPFSTGGHEDEGRRDWSDLKLLEVPLQNIASRLNTIDHVRFRAVCTSWRASTPKRAKTPILIVSRNGHDSFRFYDHIRDENIPQPLDVAIYTARDSYVYTGCSFGWIALGSEYPAGERGLVVTLTLINPFTAARVQLSRLMTGCWMSSYGSRVLLSGSPANVQQPPMVVYYSVVRPRQDLKFQQMGDNEWKTIPQTKSLAEVIACRGRFYGIIDEELAGGNQIYSIDLQANDGNGAIVQLILDLPDIFSGGVPPPRWKFLADFSGDLVVCSHNETEYMFLRVDFENMRLVQMPNLAGCLLFQCKSCSFFYRDNNAGDHHGSSSLLAQQNLRHDGRHIVHTGSPHHVIIIFAKGWQHPDPRILHRAWALGWITPDLNMES